MLPSGQSFLDVQQSNQIEVGGDVPNVGLRIQFKIKKNEEKDPNTAELTLTNLSERTRGALNAKGLKVTIEAGYADSGLTLYFRGDSRTTDHVRNGASWDTLIKCGSGERSYQNARLSESFAPGVKASAIIKKLANATGLAIGNTPGAVADLETSFDQGYSVDGPAWRSLAKLAKSIGYVLSCQDETIQIRLPNSTLDAQIPLISPQTGLVDSPQMGSPEKKGGQALCQFKSLLQPARPGAKVHLRSERYDSDVLVKKVEFTGDTFAKDWYTDYEGEVLKKR